MRHRIILAMRYALMIPNNPYPRIIETLMRKKSMILSMIRENASHCIIPCTRNILEITSQYDSTIVSRPANETAIIVISGYDKMEIVPTIIPKVRIPKIPLIASIFG